VKQIEAVKLRAYLERWRATYPYRWQQGARAVANDLLQDVAFTDIKIASPFEAPGGMTIAQVVESVLAFPVGPEAAVVMEAIEIAAKEQTSGQLAEALATSVLAILF
jgi:hypothetical protein